MVMDTRTCTIWGMGAKSGAATIAQSGLQEDSLDCPEVVKKTSRSRYYKPANPGHVLMQQLLTPWPMRSPSPSPRRLQASVAAGRMSHTADTSAMEQVVSFPLMTNKEVPVTGTCSECESPGLVLKVGKGKPYCACCWHEFVTAASPRAASVRGSQQSVPTVKTVSGDQKGELVEGMSNTSPNPKRDRPCVGGCGYAAHPDPSFAFGGWCCGCCRNLSKVAAAGHSTEDMRRHGEKCKGITWCQNNGPFEC